MHHKRALFIAMMAGLAGSTAVYAGNYSDTVLATPGLSAYWRLNETVASGISTTWADASGNGHTGGQTIHQARVPTLNISGPRPDQGFQGFELDNTSARFNRNQSILAQDDPDLDIGTGNFTMEAWAKTSSNLTTLALLGKHDNSFANGYLMMTNWWDVTNHDAAARFRRADSTEISPNSPGFTDWGTGNTWHHMVAVLHRNGGGPEYAASGMSVYLDGVLAGSRSSTLMDGFDIDNAYEFAIGAANRDGSVGFVGDLDEVSLYKRALSATEVAAHFAAALNAASAANATWNVNSDGSWTTSANWQGGVPNAVGATANFGTIITASRTVTLDANQTVGSINFSSPIAYAIDGTASLTLSVSSGNASITVTVGNHTIAAPVTLNSDLNVSADIASSIALTGSFTADGRSITKSGAGTFQAQNIRAAALNVTGGTVAILAKGSSNSPAGTSVVETLAISTGARLDLTNNSFILNYSGTTPLNTVRTLLQTGIASGEGIVTSSGSTALRIGYAEAADLSIGTFAGQSVDTSAVVMELTLAGDADLNLTVDSMDFTRFTTGYGALSDSKWTDGDFNYDGKINTLDFNQLAGNFGQTTPAAMLGSVVPEPGSMLVMAMGVFSLLQRRSCR